MKYKYFVPVLKYIFTFIFIYLFILFYICKHTSMLHILNLRKNLFVSFVFEETNSVNRD